VLGYGGGGGGGEGEGGPKGRGWGAGGGMGAPAAGGGGGSGAFGLAEDQGPVVSGGKLLGDVGCLVLFAVSALAAFDTRTVQDLSVCLVRQWPVLSVLLWVWDS
jgi:hypothetical protein